MAENDELEFDDEEESKGKKGLIFVILILLLAGGSVAGLHFTGKLDELMSDGEKVAAKDAVPASGDTQTEAASGAVVYYDLPHIMANLNPGSPTPSFIKTTITLEAPNQNVVTRIEALQPKVMDIINTYVRELRPNDLKGSAGIYRLRDELMLRVNKALYPEKVNNILFKEILIQ